MLRNVDIAQCKSYGEVVNVFDGLADPTRLRVLELLAEHEELPAGRIAGHEILGFVFLLRRRHTFAWSVVVARCAGSTCAAIPDGFGCGAQH